MNNKFPKQEKLKSRKTIEQLFTEGKSYTQYPLKVFYVPQLSEKPNQAGFSVPKRKFKLAVDRNRIKRQIRETYRLNKSILNKNEDDTLAMLFLFLGKEEMKYEVIEKAMKGLLNKLASKTF